MPNNVDSRRGIYESMVGFDQMSNPLSSVQRQTKSRSTQYAGSNYRLESDVRTSQIIYSY